MSEDQEKALKSLERALKRCAKMGISLRGMDDCLYASFGDDPGDAYSQRESGDMHEIKDHGTYIDSGGW